MKRIAPFVLLAALLAALISPVFAAAVDASAPPPAADKSPASGIATAVTTLTGIAISPLLGTGGFGLYQWYRAKTPEQKAGLSWFAKPGFFVPALLIAVLCACKDAIGTVLPPGFKKPIDILETVENKASGLVAAGAIVPFTMSTLSKWIMGSGDGTAAAVRGFADSGLAMLHLGAADLSWLLNLLTVPFGLAVFAFVWMASHTINVLILLSPWGAIDAALKAMRASVLGLLTVSAQLDPEIAAILSGVVIVFAYFVAGWSFRLTVFGTLFCWDFFTLRKRRFKPAPAENRLFSGGALKGVAVRTYGRLINQPEYGKLVFAYKPWLVLPEKTVDVKLTAPHVGRGLFFSSIRDGDRTVLLLPPRYRGHEEEIAAIYKLEGGVKDAGLLKAWGALRELFSRSATEAQVM
jgi:MFS family permease